MAASQSLPALTHASASASFAGRSLVPYAARREQQIAAHQAFVTQRRADLQREATERAQREAERRRRVADGRKGRVDDLVTLLKKKEKHAEKMAEKRADQQAKAAAKRAEHRKKRDDEMAIAIKRLEDEQALKEGRVFDAIFSAETLAERRREATKERREQATKDAELVDGKRRAMLAARRQLIREG